MKIVRGGEIFKLHTDKKWRNISTQIVYYYMKFTHVKYFKPTSFWQILILETYYNYIIKL